MGTAGRLRRGTAAGTTPNPPGHAGFSRCLPRWKVRISTPGSRRRGKPFGPVSPQLRRPAVPVAYETISFRTWDVSTASGHLSNLLPSLRDIRMTLEQGDVPILRPGIGWDQFFADPALVLPPEFETGEDPPPPRAFPAPDPQSPATHGCPSSRSPASTS